MNQSILQKEKTLEIILVISLIILGSSLRLLPHYYNATPVAAMALFSGFYLRRKFTFLIPIATMLISDYFLGFYDWKLMASVYVSFILVGLLGIALKKYKKTYTLVIGSFVGSMIFFMITNLAVWLFTNWYPRTLEGIANCYLMALPFLKSTLLGDIFYVIVFFGSYALAKAIIKKSYQPLYNENTLN